MSQFSRQFDGFDIQQVVSPILELLEKITTLTNDIDRIIVSNEKMLTEYPQILKIL